MKTKYDVLILFRKEGKDIAEKLQESLKKRGYRVHIDPCGTDVSECIDECVDFIPILSKDAWVVHGTDDLYIKGIQYALEKKRCNVVPIITRGVEFPQEKDLPDEIKKLAKKNSVFDQIVPQTFDGIVKLLNQKLLISRQPIDPKIQSFLITSVVIACLSIGILCFQMIKERTAFPFTNKEKDLVSSVITNFNYRGMEVNEQVHTLLTELYTDLNYYLTVNSSYEAERTIRKKLSEITSKLDNSSLIYSFSDEKILTKADSSKLLRDIKETSYSNYSDFFHHSVETYKNRVALINFYFEKGKSEESNLKWAQIYPLLNEELRVTENYMAHMTCLLLSNVSKNNTDLINFKTMYYSFSFPDIYWSDDKGFLKNACIQDRHSLETMRSKLNINTQADLQPFLQTTF